MRIDSGALVRLEMEDESSVPRTEAGLGTPAFSHLFSLIGQLFPQPASCGPGQISVPQNLDILDSLIVADIVHIYDQLRMTPALVILLS